MSEPSPDPDTRETTRALIDACAGHAASDQRLSDLVYQDLRRVATNLLRRERANHTLQPTALVHEAWMRLVDEPSLTGEDAGAARRKFLGYAAHAMRRILIEHARARTSVKRGGGLGREPLTDAAMLSEQDAHEWLDLDQALDALAEQKPRAAQIAELRIYGGLSTAEAAAAVNVSLATAKADWALAQALLSAKVRGQQQPD